MGLDTIENPCEEELVRAGWSDAPGPVCEGEEGRQGQHY